MVVWVITVVVTDNTDRTGANVTLLIIQMEQDVRVFLSLLTRVHFYLRSTRREH